LNGDLLRTQRVSEFLALKPASPEPKHTTTIYCAPPKVTALPRTSLQRRTRNLRFCRHRLFTKLHSPSLGSFVSLPVKSKISLPQLHITGYGVILRHHHHIYGIATAFGNSRYKLGPAEKTGANALGTGAFASTGRSGGSFAQTRSGDFLANGPPQYIGVIPRRGCSFHGV